MRIGDVAEGDTWIMLTDSRAPSLPNAIAASDHEHLDFITPTTLPPSPEMGNMLETKATSAAGTI